MWEGIICFYVSSSFKIRCALTDQRYRIKRRELVIGISYSCIIIMFVINETSVARRKLIFRNSKSMTDTGICSSNLFDRYPYLGIMRAGDSLPVIEFSNTIIFINLENKSCFGNVFQISGGNIPIEKLIHDISFKKIVTINCSFRNFKTTLSIKFIS